jgi:hypothetical protein
MTAELDARLTRQGLIWDNLYGPPNSREMVRRVRQLVADGIDVGAAIAEVEGGDDGEAEADDFIVPRHG